MTLIAEQPPLAASAPSSCCIRVIGERPVRMPLGIDSYEAFAAWVASDDFPDDGPVRFAWIDGCLEIEIAGSDPFLHESPKSEIGAVLRMRVRRLNVGDVDVDRLPPGVNLPGNAPGRSEGWLSSVYWRAARGGDGRRVGPVRF